MSYPGHSFGGGGSYPSAEVQSLYSTSSADSERFHKDSHGYFQDSERKYLYVKCQIFVAASHQTRLDTRSKARRPIKVGIKGRGRSGRSRDSNPACLCCSSAHLVQCEPDEASGFTNPNVGPGTYASLRLKLDAWSSAVQRGQKCSSPTRRLPSRSWGPIRPRVCSWFYMLNANAICRVS